VFTLIHKSVGLARKTNPRLFAVLILLNLFQGAFVYLQFTSFSDIVDGIAATKAGMISATDLISPGIVLAVSFVVPAIIGNVITYGRNKFRLQMDLQIDLYRIEQQSTLDIATLESSYYQNLLKGAQEWGTNSILTIFDFIFNTAAGLASIATSLVILWGLSAWLVLFAIIAATPVYFAYKKYSMELFRTRWLSLESHRLIANRQSHFDDLFKAIDVILLELKPWLHKEVKDHTEQYNASVSKGEFRKTVSYGVLSVWYLLLLFAAIALMGWKAVEGTMEIGALLLAFNTYTRFYQTTNTFIESFSITEEAVQYAARWFELFELKPKIYSRKDPTSVALSNPPTIVFDNVSFKYPSIQDDQGAHHVLKNISFTIRPGEKLAIIGENGSGKTTLIKLLCRIYDPSEGCIRINGVDLRNISLEQWQNSLGILFQDFPTYNVTIGESIAIGRIKEPVNTSRLSSAAIHAGADDFINSFQRRFDQLIWKQFKDGTDLSKGQHQRLAVARMFYRNAPITILDEPTASVDAITEEKIFLSLEKNMTELTVVLITHRLSSVKNASKIIVLNQGAILEQGTHEELIKSRSNYFQLYQKQASKYAE